jgi:hypothetical protein
VLCYGVDWQAGSEEDQERLESVNNELKSLPLHHKVSVIDWMVASAIFYYLL